MVREYGHSLCLIGTRLYETFSHNEQLASCIILYYHYLSSQQVIFYNKLHFIIMLKSHKHHQCIADSGHDHIH